jgi:hypothetical protein
MKELKLPRRSRTAASVCHLRSMMHAGPNVLNPLFRGTDLNDVQIVKWTIALPF